jgi:hypothetical protein
MKIFRAGLILMVPFLFVTGCGVTLSPVKRKPLEILPMQTRLAASTQKLQVTFENTLPDIPLADTVWDNSQTAFVDPIEADQIGFTQDYTRPLMNGAPAMVAPSYTRLVIPFGHIFEGVFQSGLKQAFPDATVTLTATNATAKSYIVKLKVIDFEVWEEPLNHINLKAVVECRFRPAGTSDQTEFVYVARAESLEQSIGALATSAGIMKNMETIANNFAAQLSEDILEHLQNKIGK